MRFVMVMVLVLGGCVATVTLFPPQSPSLLATCGAAGLIGQIGEPMAGFVQPAAAQTLRVLRPGDPVTEDYSATRLNVILDGQDRISGLSCG